MSLLFGNAAAIEHARTQGGGDYPSGTILSMVTWRQQEDLRWLGANIPAPPSTVEFVTARAAEDARVAFEYRKFEGVPLRETAIPAKLAAGPIAWLLARRAAVMP